MRILLTIVVIGFILLATGCSGAAWNPITADEPAASRDSLSGHFPWGLWQFIADPDACTLNITPLRSPDMHLNALRFLEPPPNLFLTVENLQINGKIIDVDIGLRHPFLGLEQYTGFDVCGALISNGDYAGFSDPDLRMAGEGNTRLLNADGYTRWWNPAEFPHADTMLGYKDGLLGTPDSVADFNCTLNGYKLFCDDLADPDAPVGDVDPQSRCVFSAGAKNVRHYTIEMAAGGMIFNYAVDACWMPPGGSPPWDVPDDFPPGANRPEAWNIVVTETANTLWNDGTGCGGGLSLEIDLWDHYDAVEDALYLESPGNFDPVGPVSPTVVSDYGALFKVDITSATPSEGSIDILIIAECEKVGYQDLLPGEPVAAYFIHTASVGTGLEDIIWVDDDAVPPYLGTFDQPYPTITMGIEAADATYPTPSWIKVKDGTYEEEVLAELGKVVIEGQSTPAPLIISPDGSLQDLIIMSTTADDMTVRHFRLMPRTGNRGIYACGSKQVIDDIEFIDNPGGPTCSSAIYVGSWVGIGNVINNVRVDGYHLTSYSFISASGADIKVTNCVLLNITFVGPSCLTVLYVNGNIPSGPVPDLLVAKNVIGHITHDATIDDSEWCRAVDCIAMEGATVRNNLIFDVDNKYTGGWTWGIEVDDACGATVEHNTIARIKGPSWIYGFEVGDSNADPAGTIHRDHIVADLTTTGSMQGWRWAYLGHWDGELPVDYSCAYNVGNAFHDTDEVVEGVGFIYSNPQFRDPNNDDYRLMPASPASGTAHDGTDMGAYGGDDPLTWLPG